MTFNFEFTFIFSEFLDNISHHDVGAEQNDQVIKQTIIY